MADKKESEVLREALLMKNKNGYSVLTEEELKECESFCSGYSSFMTKAKIEREAVCEAIKLAEEKGFTEFERGKKYSAGDKVYANNRGKSLILAVIGRKPAKHGVRIAAAHIDSPRLDLKPNPVYEDSELAFFKTHYYGGIKKYQWTTVPLSLHGVIVKRDGTKVSVCLGEKEDEPQFCITDLLPHLADAQMKKPAYQAVAGESLNVLIGSRPFASDEGSDAVKLNVMKLLNDKYGIVESDFLSAELELVPAYGARDIGFDRSMIGAYGQDDKVCAYPALMAALACEEPEYTAVTVLADKEEIGSEGNTGLKCAYLRYFIEDLAEMDGGTGREALSNSICLSADVNAAYDPNYAEVYEKRNSCLLNHGVVITKYTGARGKSGTSDASAEYMFKIRNMLDNAGVLWQAGELGKVDGGGGGTVAMYIANLNVDVVDLGVPVLSMHAPFEIVAKIDVYMAFRAIEEFFKI